MEQSQKSGINVYIGNMMSQFSLQYIVDVCHSFPPVFERIFPGQNQGYSQFDRKYFTGFCHHLCHGGSKLSLLQPLFELKFVNFSIFRNKCYDFVNRWNWGNRPECSDAPLFLNCLGSSIIQIGHIYDIYSHTSTLGNTIFVSQIHDNLLSFVHFGTIQGQCDPQIKTLDLKKE